MKLLPRYQSDKPFEARPQSLEERRIVDGLFPPPFCGLSGRGHPDPGPGQSQTLFPLEEGPGLAGEPQHRVIPHVLLQVPQVDQLADQAPPGILGDLPTNPVGGEPVVSQVRDPLAVGAAEDLDYVPHAEPLADPKDAGERLPGLFSGVKAFRWVESDVAVAAIILKQFAKIAEKHPAAAGEGFGKTHHGIKLVEFDPVLVRIAS